MIEKEFKKRYGYDIKLNEDDKTYTILNVPLYPQSNKKSRRLYQTLERACLLEGNTKFPNKVDKFQIEICGDEIEKSWKLEFDDVYQVLKLFELNPKNLHFIKLEIIYPKRTSTLPNLIINVYEFNENGTNEIENEFDFLEFSSIYYNKKPFTKKRIEVMKKMGLKINEIVQIPALPMILLEFNEDGILKPIEYLNRAKKKLFEEVYP